MGRVVSVLCLQLAGCGFTKCHWGSRFEGSSGVLGGKGTGVWGLKIQAFLKKFECSVSEILHTAHLIPNTNIRLKKYMIHVIPRACKVDSNLKALGIE